MTRIFVYAGSHSVCHSVKFMLMNIENYLNRSEIVRAEYLKV